MKRDVGRFATESLYQCSRLGASAHVAEQNLLTFQGISSENLLGERQKISPLAMSHSSVSERLGIQGVWVPVALVDLLCCLGAGGSGGSFMLLEAPGTSQEQAPDSLVVAGAG